MCVPLKVSSSSHITEGRLAVRDDRAPWADVGLREHLVSTLMSFSDNWLRLGLETLFGEVLCSDDDFNVTRLVILRVQRTSTHSSASLRSAISFVQRFSVSSPPCPNYSSALADTVLKRILFDASLAARFASPNSPHLYTEGFEAALKKHTLRRYVALVFFLDRAKKANILPGAEPLFRINASCKVRSGRFCCLRKALSVEQKDLSGPLHPHLNWFSLIFSFL